MRKSSWDKHARSTPCLGDLCRHHLFTSVPYLYQGAIANLCHTAHCFMKRLVSMLMSYGIHSQTQLTCCSTVFSLKRSQAIYSLFEVDLEARIHCSYYSALLASAWWITICCCATCAAVSLSYERIPVADIKTCSVSVKVSYIISWKSHTLIWSVRFNVIQCSLFVI